LEYRDCLTGLYCAVLANFAEKIEKDKTQKETSKSQSKQGILSSLSRTKQDINCATLTKDV